MNREEFNQKRSKGSDLAKLLTCYQFIDSLEEQIQGLQSLIDLKQQEISVLESKVGGVKTCDGCKHENMEEGDGLYHVYCGNCLRIHIDEFEPKDTK